MSLHSLISNSLPVTNNNFSTSSSCPICTILHQSLPQDRKFFLNYFPCKFPILLCYQSPHFSESLTLSLQCFPGMICNIPEVNFTLRCPCRIIILSEWFTVRIGVNKCTMSLIGISVRTLLGFVIFSSTFR